MKKKVKTVCQIIRFRGKIEAFLVSIDLFDIPRPYPSPDPTWPGLAHLYCIIPTRRPQYKSPIKLIDVCPSVSYFTISQSRDDDINLGDSGRGQ